jgi:hypothetical protein
MATLVSRVRDTAGDTKSYAPVLSYLLTPVAITGYALALWRLGADLEWTSDFFISDGIFSKWQVWLALAVATQVGAHHLNNRSGRSGDAAGA